MIGWSAVTGLSKLSLLLCLLSVALWWRSYGGDLYAYLCTEDSVTYVFLSEPYEPGILRVERDPRARSPDVRVAYHWITAGTAAMPAAWLVLYLTRVRQQRRRVREGLCRACGYDLRATPDRCPECGTMTPEVRGQRRREVRDQRPDISD
jgi:hypothetical protein